MRKFSLVCFAFLSCLGIAVAFDEGSPPPPPGGGAGSYEGTISIVGGSKTDTGNIRVIAVDTDSLVSINNTGAGAQIDREVVMQEFVPTGGGMGVWVPIALQLGTEGSEIRSDHQDDNTDVSYEDAFMLHFELSAGTPGATIRAVAGLYLTPDGSTNTSTLHVDSQTMWGTW